jgi:hypothetical protein
MFEKNDLRALGFSATVITVVIVMVGSLYVFNSILDAKSTLLQIKQLKAEEERGFPG